MKKESYKEYKNIDKSFYSYKKYLDYLNYLKPTNTAEEKGLFFNALSQGKQYNPTFKYLKSNVNKLLQIEERLNTINIPTDNPLLTKLFNHELRDIKNRIKLIKSIGTKEFNNYSKEVFGKIDKNLLITAINRVKKTNKLIPSAKKNETITIEAAKKEVKRILKENNLLKWKFEFKVNETPCVFPTEQLIILPKKNEIDLDFFNIIVRHEIIGHAIQQHYSSRSEWQLLKYGFGLYETLNEGFALFEEAKINKHTWNRVYLYYIAVNLAKDNNFFCTFKELCTWLNKEEAYKLTERVKLGLSNTADKGCFLKDKVYLEGLHMISKYSEKEMNIVKKAKFDYRFTKEVKELIN